MSQRIEKFQDLIAWQRARILHQMVFQSTRSPNCDQYEEMRDQLRRSALSAMSNLAEGFERGYRGDFHRFLVIAKGSAGEVLSLLTAAGDVECMPVGQIEGLVSE